MRQIHAHGYTSDGQQVTVSIDLDRLRDELRRIADAPEGPTAGVLTEVQLERQIQDQQHGGPEHDDSVTMEEWSEKIRSRAGQAVHEPSMDDVRRLYVEVAAIAVAAIEAIDRL